MGLRALALSVVGLALAAPAHGQDAPAPAKPAWSVEDPGGPYRDLEFDANEGTWISVDCSPDGTRLAFDLLGDIWTMPIAGGDATCVADGLPWEHQPRWSPDGNRLLFTSDRGGGDNLWTMAADGSDRKALTSEDYRLFNNGNWHPSGRFVVGRKHFTSRRSLGAGEMWLLPFPEGGVGLQITKRKNDQQDAGEPVFSPDGTRLYWSEDMSGGERFEYNKDPHGVIYRVRQRDLETGEVRDLLSLPGGAVRPQPSPDGKSLAFVRRSGNGSVLSLLDLGTAAVRDLWDGLSLDQQETWAIFGPHPGYSWTPDGASIVISARGRIWRVAVADGKAAEIPFRAPVKQRLCETVRTPGSEGAP
ncbi:MAG TPA: amidohydrolase, partial [Planctomycetota bacterium]|nr:amidohydrolase [Planctomycetota bacterium]